MYHVSLYLNPKGRKPVPDHGISLGNKRNAIREARRMLRKAWASRDQRGTVLVRAAVRTEEGTLLYQARIDEETFKNGDRRLIHDEEL